MHPSLATVFIIRVLHLLYPLILANIDCVSLYLSVARPIKRTKGFFSQNGTMPSLPQTNEERWRWEGLYFRVDSLRFFFSFVCVLFDQQPNISSLLCTMHARCAPAREYKKIQMESYELRWNLGVTGRKWNEEKERKKLKCAHQQHQRSSSFSGVFW